MEIISKNTYKNDELSVEEAISREVEFMQDVPEGYNAKNWKIEVEFLEKSFILKSFGDGKKD